jgi:hypothetical protein
MPQTIQNTSSGSAAFGIDRDLLLPPLTSFDGLSKNPFVPKP